MALNKIRLLSEEELINLIKEGGNEDITKILYNRNINGKQFLELSELQAFSWKLSQTQQRSLFNFIKQVTDNPSIIIKQPPVTKLKPKPNLFIPPKPTNTSNHDFPPKPNLPNDRSPLRDISIKSTEDKDNFKKKLGNLLGGVSPQVPTIPIDDVETVVGSNSENGTRTDGGLSLKEVKAHKLPLPPPVVSTKPKPFLPEPIVPEQNRHLPATNHLRNRNQSSTTEDDDDMEGVPLDYAYVTPEDIPPSVFNQLLLQQQNNKLVTRIAPPVPSTKTMVLQNANRKPLPLPEDQGQQDARQLSIENRPLLPLPVDQNSSHSKSLADLTKENGDFRNKALPKHRTSDVEISNNIMGDYLDLDSGEVHKSMPELSVTKPKCSLNNLQNVIITTPEDKRGNSLFEAITKFFTEKKKTSKSEVPKVTIVNPSRYSYENHMVIGEGRTVPTLETISIKNRPLPDIPPREIQNHLVNNGPSLNIPDPESKSPNITLRQVTPQKLTMSKNINNENVSQGNLENDDNSVTFYANVEELRISQQHRSKRPGSENFHIKENAQRNISNTAAAPTDQENGEPLYENYNQMTLTGKNRKHSWDKPVNDKITEAEAPGYQNLEVKNSDKTTQKLINNYENHDVTKPIYDSFANTKSKFQTEIERAFTERLKSKEAGRSKTENTSDPIYMNIEQRSEIHNGLQDFNIEADQALQDVSSSDFKDDVSDQPLYLNVGQNLSLEENIAPSVNTQNLIRLANMQTSLHNHAEEDENIRPIYENIAGSEALGCAVPVENPSQKPPYEDDHYVDSIFNITNEPFYRNTNRQGAKDLLKNLPEGAFLFRPSEHYFLVLALKHHGKYYNLGIERLPNNNIRLNADTTSFSPEFSTLRAFMDYFTKEAVTFQDNDELVEIFLNPVLPRDSF